MLYYSKFTKACLNGIILLCIKENYMENYINLFKNINNTENKYEAFCPYRVCPVGAHSDHQYGFVTGFAIDKGIHVLYNINDDNKVIVSSINFDGTEEFIIDELKEKRDCWAD